MEKDGLSQRKERRRKKVERTGQFWFPSVLGEELDCSGFSLPGFSPVRAVVG
jgi:hypothetical protein